MQIFGGRGYDRSYPVERLYRELRVDRIWEGTSEIQRLIIAGELVKRGTGVLQMPVRRLTPARRVPSSAGTRRTLPQRTTRRHGAAAETPRPPGTPTKEDRCPTALSNGSGSWAAA